MSNQEGGAKVKTPQTDDLARGNHVVPTEWAQQLERERDEALADGLEQARLLGMGSEREAKLISERNEAREDLEHWKIEYEIVVSRLCGIKHERDNGIIAEHEIIPVLRKERDEARENLDEEMKFHHRTHSELIQTQCKLLGMEMKCDQSQDEIKRLKVILDLIKKDVS